MSRTEARLAPHRAHHLRQRAGALETDVDGIVVAARLTSGHPIVIRLHEIARVSVPEILPDISDAFANLVNDRDLRLVLFSPFGSLCFAGIAVV